MHGIPEIQQRYAAYRQQYPVQKLHLGCGDHILPGWFNTDIWIGTPDTIPMDASQPFPFPDSVYDYVYTEHNLEHLPFESGYRMLQECFRVLKPGGRIRIACPDLAVLAQIYLAKSRTDLQTRFLDHITDTYMPEFRQMMQPQSAPVLYRDQQAAFVLNAYFRLWGHQFMYDEPLLSRMLQTVGFHDIVRREPGNSPDRHLQNIENRGRTETYDVETFVLEATRP